MSIAATWIWAPALLTSAEKAYTNGFVGLFWFLVPNVVCLIIFIPFAKKIRSEMPQGITLSGYMRNKYNSNGVKNVYLMQLTGLAIFSTAVQLLAGGKILSAATGLPFWLMTIILAAIAFSYSQFSGLKADVLTDAIQLVFIIVACDCFCDMLI
jgi:Na+/proline symporter